MYSNWKTKRPRNADTIQSRFHSGTAENYNPVQLQERVEIELSKLMDQKHIIKLDKSSD